MSTGARRLLAAGYVGKTIAAAAVNSCGGVDHAEGEGGGNELYGNVEAQARIVGAIDFAHAAGANMAAEFTHAHSRNGLTI